MGAGLGTTLLPSSLWPNNHSPVPQYDYPEIKSLKEATNEAGELALRLALQGKNKVQIEEVKARIKIRIQGRLHRVTSYFLEPPDQENLEQGILYSSLPSGDFDIMVAWIQDANETTLVEFQVDRAKHQFTLGELLEQGELIFEGDVRLSANLLGYHEIGKLDTKNYGIPNKDSFRFAIMADPQGGDARFMENDSTTRMKIHNAFIEEAVALVNGLKPEPEFTIIIGDFVDSKGQEENFISMEKLVAPIQGPILLSVGNHETKYNADFSPGYNMKPLTNFFSSQKRLNGSEKILYSFDLGAWHFVVWPDPLRSNFWQNHPHYFDWLENDLEENKDRPVVFFHHVPLHPIGIDPLTTYVESISVKKLLIEILAKYGNVKYIFSGHVHIPLKASVKTAVTYKGMNMINLPATGYRPRAFGEPDFFGGPEQGICIVDIQGKQLDVHFQHVTREWYTYPKKFREFDDEKHALWFNHAWELPLNDGLKNGDFRDGFNFWHQRYVYHEDTDPSNRMEIRSKSNEPYAYLYSRKRDYDVPGQDRLPQFINQLAQAVSLEGMDSPELTMEYWLDPKYFDPQSLNSFFVWLECYNKSHNVGNLIYSPGKIYGNVTSGFGAKKSPSKHFHLLGETGKWHSIILPFGKDLDALRNSGIKKSKLPDPDRVVVRLGTWTINEGMEQQIGVGIRKLSIGEFRSMNTSTPKSNEDIWYGGIRHVAGEHSYVDQKRVYPKGLNGS